MKNVTNSVQDEWGAAGGASLTFYHDPDFCEEEVDVELAVPVANSPQASGRIRLTELPAVPEMATCILEGGYEQIGEAYEPLMRWIETNNYQVAGPPREVYLRGPKSSQDPDDYLTEIQIPACRHQAQ